MGYDMSLVEPDPEVTARKEAVQAAFYVKAEERDNLIKERGNPRPTYPDQQSFDPVYEDPEINALQIETSRLSEEMYRVDTNYFRANIWGMRKFREDMDTLGMLDVSSGHTSPDWPELSDYGLTEYPDEDSKLLTPEEKRFIAAGEAVRGAEAKDIVGIPLYKFGSNDGWIVTPAEITYALKMYETADGDARRAVREGWMPDDGTYCRWDAWIQFLEIARDKGHGFEVW